MMNRLKKLEDEISAWPHVSIHPHRFGGREFRFGDADVGHIAEEHRWVPNSGWITFRVRGEGDLKHALWLMKLSYLRHALKISADPRRLLEQESERLQLSSQ